MLKAIIASIKVELKELMRKKDFYLLLIFLMVLLFAVTQQGNFGVEGATRYMVDLGYTLVTLFSLIIAVTFTAKQLPAEIKNKTIYPLVAKPVSRMQIILFKYAGSLFISIFSYTVFYIVFSYFYFNFADRGGLVLLSQSYVLGIFLLFLITSIVLFFSNILTVGANIALTFLFYLGINGFVRELREIVVAAEGVNWFFWNVLYYIIPHFEFFDMRVRLTHQWDILPLWVIVSCILYSLVYSVVMLQLAGSLFRRKKL